MMVFTSVSFNPCTIAGPPRVAYSVTTGEKLNLINIYYTFSSYFRTYNKVEENQSKMCCFMKKHTIGI